MEKEWSPGGSWRAERRKVRHSANPQTPLPSQKNNPEEPIMSDFRFSGRCSVLLSAALMVHAHASTSGNADVIGTWLLTKVLDQAEVTAMDDKQAAKLIGRTLVIRPDGIIFSGEPCQRSDVERHKEDAANSGMAFFSMPSNNGPTNNHPVKLASNLPGRCWQRQGLLRQQLSRGTLPPACACPA